MLLRENPHLLIALDAMQEDLANWQRKHFNEEDCKPEWMALGAAEEIGELCHVLLKSRQKIRSFKNGLDEDAKATAADAVGDTVVFLMQLCTKLDIKFSDALTTTVKEVLHRDWTNNKTNGENND